MNEASNQPEDDPDPDDDFGSEFLDIEETEDTSPQERTSHDKDSSPDDAFVLALNSVDESRHDLTNTVDWNVKPTLPEAVDTSNTPSETSFPTVDLDIPGYEILEKIGEGTTGVVYRARQQSLNRIVALKMLVTGGHGASLARARTEAESVAHLQHPNIIQIFEVQEHSNAIFFAFEFVDGGSLDPDQIANPRKAAEIVEVLSRGVQYAHQRGVVHRDLKPDNVLLTSDGIPKIADFGLAKRLKVDTSQTVDGAVLGTPHYMSPEQALGKSAGVGPASDIYALGSILYRLITGRTPFDDDDFVSLLRSIRNSEPVLPRKIDAKIHRDLETICLKAMEKTPASRYQSADDLADDLQRFLAGETILAKPTSTVVRSIRWARKRTVLVALVATLLVMTSLAVMFAITHYNDASEQLALEARTPIVIDQPAGLPTFSVPSDNPVTKGKVKLGKQLFFDVRLSQDNMISCSDCHRPSDGWSDARMVSLGIDQSSGKRNSMPILNAAYNRFLFWDGRSMSLEEQAVLPLTDPLEMGVTSLDELAEEISEIPDYKKQFEQVFDDGVTARNIGQAIAAFERTLVAGNSPYDRFAKGDETALSDSAKRGLHVFENQGHCSACHSGALFSDGGFHNTGIGLADGNQDDGRFAITGRRGDKGSFRTPSLRDIVRTSPYMHDGKVKTLAEVVEFYVKGGHANANLDEEMFPLELTDQQKADLIEFLKVGLTSDHYPVVEKPSLPGNT